jgi:hypothetical protein
LTRANAFHLEKNQFRSALSPQPQLAVKRWPIFGFGLRKISYFSFPEDELWSSATAMGSFPTADSWTRPNPPKRMPVFPRSSSWSNHSLFRVFGVFRG